MAKKSQTNLTVINPDNDFHLIQNYILQLKAEKRITSDAFVLYAFYRSLSGFATIRPGYKYISANTGLSVGAISKSNALLVSANLIRIENHGERTTHTITLLPGNSLPRRVLVNPYDGKKICDSFSPGEQNSENCSPDEKPFHSVNKNGENCSPGEPIYKFNKNIGLIYNTTTGDQIQLNPAQVKFINKFRGEWCSRNQTRHYPKNDFMKIFEIDDPSEAFKYIPTLWTLDENDSWVRNSDHSLTIFVKEYKTGKLQSVYQNSWNFYQDQSR